MEVYVDEILIKSVDSVRETFKDRLSHLRGTFGNPNKYNMRLNPAKRMCGVTAGKFLGYVVMRRGIEANSVQIKVIQGIQVPTYANVVQGLTGKLAVLSYFMELYPEKTQPFFEVQKKARKFEWTNS